MAKLGGYNPQPYKGKYSGRAGRQKGHVRISGGSPPRKGCGSKKFVPTLLTILSILGLAGVWGIVVLIERISNV